MDELIHRLSLIIQARNKNLALRRKLEARLQYINTELSLIANLSGPNIQISSDVKITSLEADDSASLIRQFWGRSVPIPKPSFDSHLQMTPQEKCTHFVVQYKNSRQRSLVVNRTNPSALIQPFQHQVHFMIGTPPIINDYVRYVLFTRLFGNDFRITDVFPNIRVKAMRRLIAQLSSDTKKTIADLGIDPNTIQRILDKLQGLSYNANCLTKG